MNSPGDSADDLAPPPVIQQRRQFQQQSSTTDGRLRSLCDWLPLEACYQEDVGVPEALLQQEGRRLGALCAIAGLVPHSHILVAVRGEGASDPSILGPLLGLLPSTADTEGLMRRVAVNLNPLPSPLIATHSEPSLSEQAAGYTRRWVSEVAQSEDATMSVEVRTATSLRAALVAVQQVADILGKLMPEDAPNATRPPSSNFNSLGPHNSSMGTLGARSANSDSTHTSRRQHGVPVMMVAIHTIDALPKDMEAALTETMLHGTVTTSELVGGGGGWGGEGGGGDGEFVLRYFNIPVPAVLLIALAQSSSLSSRIPPRVREAFALSTTISTVGLRAGNYRVPLPYRKLVTALRFDSTLSSPFYEQFGLVSCSALVKRYLRESIGILQMHTEPFRHAFVGCMSKLKFYEHLARCAAYLWSVEAPPGLYPMVSGGGTGPIVLRQALLRRMQWDGSSAGGPSRPVVVVMEDVRVLLPHLFSHLLCMDTFEFYVTQREDGSLNASLDDNMAGQRLAAIEKRVLTTITDGGNVAMSGAAASLMDVAVSWDAVAGFTDSIQCVPKPTNPSSPHESTVLSHTEALNFMIYLVVNECPGVSE